MTKTQAFAKHMESGAAKVLVGVLTAIVLGGLAQGLAIYTWVKVADEQLKQINKNQQEIKADLKEATKDRYTRSEAKADHRAMWRAIRENKNG